MTPERQAQLEALERAIEPMLYPEYRRGLEEGRKQGMIFAVHELEAEVARFADAGTLEQNADTARALARAAGWLREKHKNDN